MFHFSLTPIQFESQEVIKPDVGKVITVPFRFNTQLLNSWDKRVLEIISKTKGAWCAGGAPLALYTNRVNQIKDWDIFVEDRSAWNIITDALEDFDFKKINESGYLSEWAKGENNSCIVQLISKHLDGTQYTGNSFIEAVFSGFDLSVCQIGFKDTNEFFLSNKAESDIVDKKFRVFLLTNKTDERIKRYEDKGYTLDKASLKNALKSSPLYEG